VTGIDNSDIIGNLIDVHAEGSAGNAIYASGTTIRRFDGSTPMGMTFVQMIAPFTNNDTFTIANGTFTIALTWLDIPASLSTVAYTVQVASWSSGNNATCRQWCHDPEGDHGLTLRNSPG